MNNKIQKCISTYNMKYITYVNIYIYKISSVKNQPLIDSNAIVIAEKVNVVNTDVMEKFLKNLTDEQYWELLTIITEINYADFRLPNMTLIEEQGQIKIAFLDTEDIASKFICTDYRFKFYLTNRFDVPWHNHENSKKL